MTTTTGEPPPLRTKEAAARLGVSEDTIRRWRKAGRLPFVLTPSGEPRYRPADLDAAFTNGTAQS